MPPREASHNQLQQQQKYTIPKEFRTSTTSSKRKLVILLMKTCSNICLLIVVVLVVIHSVAFVQAVSYTDSQTAKGSSSWWCWRRTRWFNYHQYDGQQNGNNWKKQQQVDDVANNDESPTSCYNNGNTSSSQPQKCSKSSSTIERGKSISREVTSLELFRAYEELKDDYRHYAFNPALKKKWKLLKEYTGKDENDTTKVYILKHPNDPSCPYVKMVASLPGDVSDVWDFLKLDNWENTMPKMDPFYDGVEIKGTFTHRGVEMILARKKTVPLLGLFGKRDFTFISVSDIPRRDGVWTSGTVSVVTDRLPRVKGYTRAFQDSVAFYESIRGSRGDEPKTLLTIICRIDLNDSSPEHGTGGAVPMWLYVKTVGTSGLMSLNNMRREIGLEIEKRRNILIDQQLGNNILLEAANPFLKWKHRDNHHSTTTTVSNTNEQEALTKRSLLGVVQTLIQKLARSFYR